jgi:Domain of unknown function (DUF4292)
LLMGLMLQACHISRFRASKNQAQHSISHPLDFEYLTINASTSFSHESNHHKLRVQFRIQRNNLIWFSARTPWGLEVARGLLTPTSVEVIDHLHHTYTVYDYANLQAQWQFPGNYYIIQAILLGELPDTHNDQAIRQINEHSIIQQQKDTWKLEATVKNGLGKIESLILSDWMTQTECRVYYSAFKVYPQGLLFRYAQLFFRDLVVNMTYSSVHWSDKALDFPFSIPRHYVKS